MTRWFCVAAIVALLWALLASPGLGSDPLESHDEAQGIQASKSEMDAGMTGRLVGRIPFEIDRNRVVLPVSVNGSHRLRVTLDSGMAWEGIYLFHKEFADTLGIETAQEAQVGGAGSGGPSTVMVVDSIMISMGTADFPNRTAVISKSDITQTFPTDGVLGGVLLNTHVVRVDFDERMIHLYDTTDVVVDTSWYTVDMTLKKGIPWIDAEVAIADEPPTKVDLYMDIAGGEALELLVRPDMKFTMPDGLTEVKYLGTGLSGDIYGRVGEICMLRIGPFDLRDVPTTFPPAEVRSKQEGADGILANQALRRFNVVFDYSRLRLYLKPNATYDVPFSETDAAR